MRLTTIPEIAPSAETAATLYDLAEALRVAHMKLGLAAAEWVQGQPELDRVDCDEAQSVCAFVHQQLLSALGGVMVAPTLPPRVFEAIGTYANKDAKNSPHLEGVVLALDLATAHILEPLRQADAEPRALIALARAAIGWHQGIFAGAVQRLDEPAELAAILGIKS